MCLLKTYLKNNICCIARTSRIAKINLMLLLLIFINVSRWQIKFANAINLRQPLFWHRFSYLLPTPIALTCQRGILTLKRRALYFDGISPLDKYLSAAHRRTDLISLPEIARGKRDIIFINHLSDVVSLSLFFFLIKKPKNEYSVFCTEGDEVAPGVLLLCSISISLYRGDIVPSSYRVFVFTSTVGANKQRRCREHETTYPFYRSKYARDPYARMPFSARVSFSSSLPCGLPAFVAAIGKTNPEDARREYTL